MMPTYFKEILECHQLDMVTETLNGVFVMMEQAVRVKCLIVTKNTVQSYASMDFPNMSYPFAPTLGY